MWCAALRQASKSSDLVRYRVSSSLPTRSMTATSSACVTAIQNASYRSCVQLLGDRAARRRAT